MKAGQRNVSAGVSTHEIILHCGGSAAAPGVQLRIKYFLEKNRKMTK